MNPLIATGPGSSLHARRIEAAALLAADAACDACRELLPAESRSGIRPDRVTIVMGGWPSTPLVNAVADLGSAAFAAARAAHNVVETRPADAVEAALHAAEVAAAAARLGANHLDASATPGEAERREELAHAAGLVAHLAADALEADAHAAARVPGARPVRDPVAFPRSWQMLLDTLERRIHEIRNGPGPRDPDDEALLRAAEGACGGARRARRTYERHLRAPGVSTAAARLCRIAALASVYAGCAALDALQSRAVA